MEIKLLYEQIYCFIKLHFTDVSTYLNSGNVIFSSDIDDKNILSVFQII